MKIEDIKIGLPVRSNDYSSGTVFFVRDIYFSKNLVLLAQENVPYSHTHISEVSKLRPAKFTNIRSKNLNRIIAYDKMKFRDERWCASKEFLDKYA